MKLAIVNDHEAAKRFFEEYDIPYEVITRGENKGKVRVKPVREKDYLKILEVKKRLEQNGLSIVCDHANVFRDKEDRAVVTFSPYDIDFLPNGVNWLEMSENSIYGLWTKTYVVRVG